MTHAGEHGLALDQAGGVDDRQQLLGDHPQRQDVALRLPRRRRPLAVDGGVEEGLLVGDHVPFEAQLDPLGAHPGVDLAVHPDGAAVELGAGGGGLLGGGELHHPAVAAVDGVGTAQAVAVGLVEGDLERQGGRLLGLDQRELRDRLAPPADAVDVEGLPGPIGALAAAAEEEGAFDRRLERLPGGAGAEAQVGGVGGRVVVDPPLLAVLEGLEAAEDLLDRHLALRPHGDLLRHPAHSGGGLQLGGGGAGQAEDGHRPGVGHPQLEAG